METHCTYYFVRSAASSKEFPGEGFEKLALTLTSSGPEFVISFPEDYKKPMSPENRPLALQCTSLEHGKTEFQRVSDDIVAHGFILTDKA